MRHLIFYSRTRAEEAFDMLLEDKGRRGIQCSQRDVLSQRQQVLGMDLDEGRCTQYSSNVAVTDKGGDTQYATQKLRADNFQKEMNSKSSMSI